MITTLLTIDDCYYRLKQSRKPRTAVEFESRCSEYEYVKNRYEVSASIMSRVAFRTESVHSAPRYFGMSWAKIIPRELLTIAPSPRASIPCLTSDADPPWAPYPGTRIHALGMRFLEAEHARVGLRRGFSILGEDDARAGLLARLPFFFGSI